MLEDRARQGESASPRSYSAGPNCPSFFLLIRTRKWIPLILNVYEDEGGVYFAFYIRYWCFLLRSILRQSCFLCELPECPWRNREPRKFLLLDWPVR